MVRLYGFFGDEDLGKLVFSGFAQPKMTGPFVDGDATYRVATETPLTGLDNDLFFPRPHVCFAPVVDVLVKCMNDRSPNPPFYPMVSR